MTQTVTHCGYPFPMEAPLNLKPLILPVLASAGVLFLIWYVYRKRRTVGATYLAVAVFLVLFWCTLFMISC